MILVCLFCWAIQYSSAVVCDLQTPNASNCLLGCINGVCEGETCRCRVGWNGTNCTSSLHDGNFWVLSITEGLFVVIGGLWLISGYRQVPILMYSSGLVFISFLSYQLMWYHLVPPFDLWLIILLSLGVGLLGGILFVSAKKYGLVFLFFLVGILFGSIICATPLHKVTQPWVPLVIVLIFGVVVPIPLLKYGEKQRGIIIGFVEKIHPRYYSFSRHLLFLLPFLFIHE
eukprot:TRINITY_DN9467_c0_g1_i2.p2 TRINITY_DN9467_c0_g1~~TRINITY_DN9467_c0_g1_i2.p2  ORF type:complete len:229 (-),score=19.78 TRINITY_DN9467_c0_g1_i2:1260-1946(-)